jgi:hypothetical protein
MEAYQELCQHLIAAAERTEHRLSSRAFSSTPSQSPAALVESLMRQAYLNGMPLEVKPGSVRSTELSGGMATQAVILAQHEVRVVIKMDQSLELLLQPIAIRNLACHNRVGVQLAGLLPKVYAIHESGPPFAYVMQCFDDEEYCSLDDIVNEPAQIAHNALSATMLSIYRESHDRRLIPSTHVHYLDRIEERLRLAGSFDGFAPFLDRCLIVNGRRTRMWQDSLHTLSKIASTLHAPGVTAVHGDLHPGNVRVARTEPSRVKLIDPKDWVVGDPAFDFGKMLHFLMVTKHLATMEQSLTYAVMDDCVRVDYTAPQCEAELCAPWWQVSATLFKDLDDNAGPRRLELSIAANLLGLPYLWLRRNMLSGAILLLSEGAKRLDVLATELAA